MLDGNHLSMKNFFMKKPIPTKFANWTRIIPRILPLFLAPPSFS